MPLVSGPTQSDVILWLTFFSFYSVCVCVCVFVCVCVCAHAHSCDHSGILNSAELALVSDPNNDSITA